MFVVFVLCVPAGGVVLRSVSVLYFLMVEKAESFLRGQWSVFNIYVLVLSGVSFLVSSCVSWRRLVVGFSLSIVLSWASCCLVSFLFLCLARGGCVGDVIRGAFHVGGISAWAFLASLRIALVVYLVVSVSSRSLLRLVFRFANRLVFVRPVLFLSPFVAGGGAWEAQAVMSLSSCGYGGGVLLPYFWLAWRVDRNAPFYSARFLIFAFVMATGGVMTEDEMRYEMILTR